MNFITKLTRETASANALLPRVLLRGSKNLPGMAEISATLDELYGTRIEAITRKKGELYGLGFYIDFPDGRYLPNSDNILEKAIDVAGELLLSPLLHDGYLCEEYIESEKSNLIDDIHAIINDKRNYSVSRLLEQMCDDEAYGVNKLGTENEAKAITKESLTSHYFDIINNSELKIFYCGSASSDQVESALKKALHTLPIRKATTTPTTEILFTPKTDEPRRFTESLDVTQGKLVAGFRMGETMKSPNYPAMMMFNAIYGDGVSSKLFVKVREELSLCYMINSMVDKHKGIMLVAGGFDFLNFDKALNEIFLQLDNIKNGDISAQEFETAKNSIISEIKSSLDRPGGLESFYFDSVTAAISYDPLTLCDDVQSVTMQDVIDIASHIKTDSIFYLKGN